MAMNAPLPGSLPRQAARHAMVGLERSTTRQGVGRVVRRRCCLIVVDAPPSTSESPGALLPIGLLTGRTPATWRFNVVSVTRRPLTWVHTYAAADPLSGWAIAPEVDRCCCDQAAERSRVLASWVQAFQAEGFRAHGSCSDLPPRRAARAQLDEYHPDEVILLVGPGTPWLTPRLAAWSLRQRFGVKASSFALDA